MGHPEDDSDPIHLMGHMSCQQKTEAVQNKVSYLLFSSVASGSSPKHFSLSSDFKNMVYKEKCEISFLLPEYYRLDLERGIGVDRFTSWLKMQNWVTHTDAARAWNLPDLAAALPQILLSASTPEH